MVMGAFKWRALVMSGRESVAASGSDEAPWQVRVWNEAGRVSGAGVLISTRHVLTCAHVVDRQAAESGRAAPPRATVQVDFPGKPGRGRLDARVLAGGWFPVGEHGEGDVAVLELARDVAGIPPARLSAPSSYFDRQVLVLGYPDDPPYGVWAEARLRGRNGPRWVQLDALAVTGQRIERGFSGAGVVDSGSGDVVGIVVTELTNPVAKVAWMLPTETIAALWMPLGDRVEHADGTVSIGELALAAVAACSPWPGGHEIHAVTRAGRLVRRRWAQNRWSHWHQVDVGVSVKDVATTSFDTGCSMCVITDVNGRARRSSSEPTGTDWSSWYLMSPMAITASPALARVAAVSSQSGHQEMFAVTGAGELVHSWLYSGQWSDWDPLDTPVPVSDIAATSPADGQIVCAATDVHGRAWHRSWSGSEWGDWQKIDAPPKTASPVLTRVAIVSGWRGENRHVEIFAVTAAGEVVHRWRSRRTEEWSDWHTKSVSSPAVDIAATSNTAGHMECFIACSDGRLYYQWLSKEMRWSSWRSINDLLQDSRN